MRKGELGVGTRRRIIFIWEGAIATLPPGHTIDWMEYLANKTHQWEKAVSYWKLNEFGVKWMWAIHERSMMRIDICVTTRSGNFAHAVSRMCERENWPVSYLTALPAHELGRRLATMPDVDRVVYGREDQRWAYGPHGYLLTPESRQLV